MVEADSHLKLLPTSILDIYKVFEHIDMLSIGIQEQPYTDLVTSLFGSYSVTSLFGSYSGVLGHMWIENDVITSWLRLTALSNYFSHPS
jgi:hypothetical protein